jgi:sugar fermentation stimulation protein A
MKFKNTLIEANLIQRYKRFFADIEYIDPKTKKKVSMTIHVPNTGSMKSVIAKPSVLQKCWFTPSDDPQRKLKGTLEAVQTTDGTWVGVNTSHPNKVVQEIAIDSIQSKKAFFKHWKKYNHYKSEIKISKETRLDGVFYLNEGDLEKKKAAKHFIEIKNTTLMTEIDGQKHAQFPDAVTERGQKHLQELMNLIDDGHQAELIFTIQRTDVKFFSIAKEIDPKYFELFTKALKKGLIVTPVIVGINQSEIKVTDQVLKIK